LTKLFLLFSHEITDKQESDARESLGVNRIIKLPADLQEKWSNVPADLNSLSDYLLPFRNWLEKESTKGDYVLVQGEFGAVYFIVTWAKRNNLTPVYSTTERKAKEKVEGEKVKTVKVFEHVKFREYEIWES